MQKTGFVASIEQARELDQSNSLRHFREYFYIPKFKTAEKIYFTGNSTGLQPKTAEEYIKLEMEEWARLGGEGHFEAKNPWYSYHELFSQQLAALAGCLPEEAVAMNSLTVNIHLLLMSFYRPDKKRFKIICEHKAFPSDQYALESQARVHGIDPSTAIIEAKPRQGEELIRNEDIITLIKEHGPELALVWIGGINYYTGQLFDMREITRAAHNVGAYAGFDLAHAIGNVDLKLHDWEVDFAAWCTYKYLNSGPGSVGGVYIHKRFSSDKEFMRLAGWWGYNKEKRFLMEKGFEAIPTTEGWQMSNAPVIPMAMHKAALDIFEEAGMENLSVAGRKLSSFAIRVLDSINEELGEEHIRIISPRDERWRGCQVSFSVGKSGRKLFDHLMDKGVSAGWREPEVIRIAPVPLYNTFEEIWRFGEILKQGIKSLS